MARIVFKKPEGGTYTPLPEGMYDWEIQGAVQTTSGKGNAQLELACVVVAPEQYAGRTSKHWYSLLPQSAWRLKKLLDAAGCDYEEGKDEQGNDVLAFDDEQLPGLFFRCKASIGENEAGNDRNEFSNESPSKFSAAPASAPQAAPPAAAPTPASAQGGAVATAPAAAAPAGTGFQPRSRRA
jgi:hypothetical protein